MMKFKRSKALQPQMRKQTSQQNCSRQNLLCLQVQFNYSSIKSRQITTQLLFPRCDGSAQAVLHTGSRTLDIWLRKDRRNWKTAKGTRKYVEMTGIACCCVPWEPMTDCMLLRPLGADD